MSEDGHCAEPSPPEALVRTAWVLLVAGLTVLLVSGAAVVALVIGGFEVGGFEVGGLGIGVRSREGVVAAARSSSGVASFETSRARRAAGIQAALDAMTDGVRRRDETTFLSAVDVGHSRAFSQERAVFRSLVLLPLVDPSYVWSGNQVEEAASPAPAGAVNVAVEFRYRLRGWDTDTAHDPFTFTFAPVKGRWLVVDDTVTSAVASAVTGGRLPVGPFAEPWVGRRVAVERRPHVLVVGDVARASDVKRLAGNLEKVVGDVRRLWPEPSWNGMVVAYASTDARFVKEWFGTQAADGKRDNPDGSVSFEARVVSLPGSFRDGDRQRGPTRLVVTPYLLGEPDSYGISVLRHEVTHVATDRLGRYPPTWLLEGAAEYTGFRLGGTRVDASRTFARHGLPTAIAAAMRKGTWHPVLVNDAQTFYGGSSKVVEAAYIDGWIAALYVADRYGDATLRRLYDVACSQPGTVTDAEVDAVALRDVLRTDHATFTAAVRTYGIDLRRQFA